MNQNKKETLKEALTRTEGLPPEEVERLLEKTKERISAGENPREILAYDLGLSLDYLPELLLLTSTKEKWKKFLINKKEGKMIRWLFFILVILFCISSVINLLN